jgi:hypothetical protein
MVYIQPSHFPLTPSCSLLRYRSSIPCSSDSDSLFLICSASSIGNRLESLHDQSEPSFPSVIDQILAVKSTLSHPRVQPENLHGYICFFNGTTTASQELFSIQQHAAMRFNFKTKSNYQGGAITT